MIPNPSMVQWQFLYTGTLKRDSTDWCCYCAKSSIVIAKVFLISINGVAPWGKFRGCRECSSRIWINRKGLVTHVDIVK